MTKYYLKVTINYLKINFEDYLKMDQYMSYTFYLDAWLQLSFAEDQQNKTIEKYGKQDIKQQMFGLKLLKGKG